MTAMSRIALLILFFCAAQATDTALSVYDHSLTGNNCNDRQSQTVQM